MQDPFLHRVEHSVHAHLFARLVARPQLAARHPIGTTGRVTQLVHKERPETDVDVAANSYKRGAYDLVVLAPAQLRAATLDHIRFGRVAAGIVIEMGLNYPYAHLKQDYDNLIVNHVPMGYLIHLSRDRARDGRVEQFLLETDRSTNIKIAYAHNGEAPKERAFKLLDETTIHP